jgi:excisionase family DNA binding protein
MYDNNVDRPFRQMLRFRSDRLCSLSFVAWGQMKAAELNDLITQAEAARLRGVTREAIYDLVARGRLETVEIGGKRFLHRTDVLDFKPGAAGRPSGTLQSRAKGRRPRKRDTSGAKW